MSVSPPIRHALIMAAGRGTRMRPLTDSIPKAMAPFRGETLIANGIRTIKRHVEHIHVTVGYKSAMLSEHLMQIGVSSIHNTEGHPNTWWMYHSLLSLLDEPIFVLTCDNVVDLDFDLLCRDYHAIGAPACMLVPVVPVPGLEGDYIDHVNRRVTRVQRDEPRDLYCSGIQVLNPHRVAAVAGENDSFFGIWDQLIAQKSLWISDVYPKEWFAMDTVGNLRSADGNRGA